MRLSFERPGRQVWAFQGSFCLALFTGSWKFFCDVRDRNGFAQIWEILVGSGRRERLSLNLHHSWKHSMEDVRRCHSLAVSNSALTARASKLHVWFFILIRFRPWSNSRRQENLKNCWQTDECTLCANFQKVHRSETAAQSVLIKNPNLAECASLC